MPQLEQKYRHSVPILQKHPWQESSTKGRWHLGWISIKQPLTVDKGFLQSKVTIGEDDNTATEFGYICQRQNNQTPFFLFIYCIWVLLLPQCYFLPGFAYIGFCTSDCHPLQVVLVALSYMISMMSEDLAFLDDSGDLAILTSRFLWSRSLSRQKKGTASFLHPSCTQRLNEFFKGYLGIQL